VRAATDTLTASEVDLDRLAVDTVRPSTAMALAPTASSSGSTRGPASGPSELASTAAPYRRPVAPGVRVMRATRC
jgi:hypothetical protein